MSYTSCVVCALEYDDGGLTISQSLLTGSWNNQHSLADLLYSSTSLLHISVFQHTSDY